MSAFSDAASGVVSAASAIADAYTATTNPVGQFFLKSFTALGGAGIAGVAGVCFAAERKKETRYEEIRNDAIGAIMLYSTLGLCFGAMGGWALTSELLPPPAKDTTFTPRTAPVSHAANPFKIR